MIKQFIKDYLSFSKKERTGVFILLAIILAGLLIPFFYGMLSNKSQATDKELDKQLETIKTKPKDSSTAIRFTPPKTSEPIRELFYFDPNIATADDWKRLGISEKTTHTILNYVSKGGHFYKPEDIRKVWGLKKEDADELIPYIRINDGKIVKPEVASSHPEPIKQQTSNPVYQPYKKTDIKPIDINLADSATLIALPGIGPSYSRRIINFRTKLGGFYSVDQVAETFGLPDSTFQKIKPKLFVGESGIKKINVNSATLEDLKAHPYIRYYIANAIVQYRTQHGNFSSIEDLKKIMLINDEVYNKISHYLTL